MLRGHAAVEFPRGCVDGLATSLLQFLRQASAPFATDASLTQRAGTSLASVEAQLLSLNQEKEALQGSINRLKKSTTVKRWTIVDETNKADARLQVCMVCMWMCWGTVGRLRFVPKREFSV